MISPHQPATAGAVDLDSCAREPIHIPGAIQPHGFLLGCTLPDWTVAQVSANCASYLGVLGPQALLGQTLEQLFPAETVHALRNLLQTAMLSGSAERLDNVELAVGDRFDLTVHVSAGLALVEGTPSLAGNAANPVTLVKGLIGRLKRAATLERFLAQAAQQLRAVTGYDRVMVYRFLHDGAGEVVAEARRPGVEPYMGLRYPASDIPEQARQLYRRQWLRLIPDVDYHPAALVPGLGPDGHPVDLGLASLRSVSPIHLQYLRNMGVRATLTVSLMQGDRLWGLIACHHFEPHRIGGALCAAAELFGQMLSLQIEAKEQHDKQSRLAQGLQAHDRLIAAMSPRDTVFDNLAQFSSQLQEMIPNDGMAVWSDRHFSGFGTTPPAEAIGGLIDFLGRSASNQVFSSHRLAEVYPPAAAWSGEASGLLAIPFSRTARDYLLFFRRETLKTVTWGGDPSKPVEGSADGDRLSPRRSFSAWQETVRGEALPWSDTERHVAETLRVSLLEVILRRAELISQERQLAQDNQSLLIAELNHRIKNVLSLVLATVRQSAPQAQSVEAFTAEVERRIEALAAAHDQINATNGLPTPLSQLLEAEALAWGGRDVVGARVLLDGPSVLLDMRAYQTLALVFHEMITNAAKYGALSNATGQLAVNWSLNEDGSLQILWTERGGPAVIAPSRRGFGSIVIERTIPFELQGDAGVEYRREGLTATFCIPSRYISLGEVTAHAPVPGHAPADALIGKRLLLVEDSMMIALDAQAMLQEAGAEVEIAGSVKEAQRALQHNRFDLAVLDVNLSGETSLGIAEDLEGEQQPFLFATGYGVSTAIPERFGYVPLVTKPYNVSALAYALNRVTENALQAERR